MPKKHKGREGPQLKETPRNNNKIKRNHTHIEIRKIPKEGIQMTGYQTEESITNTEENEDEQMPIYNRSYTTWVPPEG